jgi:hypothetical protein
LLKGVVACDVIPTRPVPKETLEDFLDGVLKDEEEEEDAGAVFAVEDEDF